MGQGHYRWSNYLCSMVHYVDFHCPCHSRLLHFGCHESAQGKLNLLKFQSIWTSFFRWKISSKQRRRWHTDQHATIYSSLKFFCWLCVTNYSSLIWEINSFNWFNFVGFFCGGEGFCRGKEFLMVFGGSRFLRRLDFWWDPGFWWFLRMKKVLEEVWLILLRKMKIFDDIEVEEKGFWLYVFEEEIFLSFWQGTNFDDFEDEDFWGRKRFLASKEL